MSAHTDFTLTIDRAAGFCTDTLVAARSAGRRPLPDEHRRLLRSATRELESAQDKLFVLSHLPWTESEPMFRVPPRRRQDQLRFSLST
jgi:hypothetical protein